MICFEMKVTMIACELDIESKRENAAAVAAGGSISRADGRRVRVCGKMNERRACELKMSLRDPDDWCACE